MTRLAEHIANLRGAVEQGVRVSFGPTAAAEILAALEAEPQVTVIEKPVPAPAPAPAPAPKLEPKPVPKVVKR